MKLTISAIKSRADRLNQPEMVDKYRELAITWDEEAGTCELIDEDREELNTMWNETGRSSTRQAPVKQDRKPCRNCGGL